MTKRQREYKLECWRIYISPTQWVVGVVRMMKNILLMMLIGNNDDDWLLLILLITLIMTRKNC